jgi:predicted nuclease of predicted toxin-antitoxin system
MHFLVDANLPPALADWLRTKGVTADHAIALGLERAADAELWDWAKARNATLISKDEDFLMLKLADPDGPKVVWVRFGNTTRGQVLMRFEQSWTAILASLARDGVVEVR